MPDFGGHSHQRNVPFVAAAIICSIVPQRPEVNKFLVNIMARSSLDPLTTLPAGHRPMRSETENWTPKRTFGPQPTLETLENGASAGSRNRFGRYSQFVAVLGKNMRF